VEGDTIYLEGDMGHFGREEERSAIKKKEKKSHFDNPWKIKTTPSGKFIEKKDKKQGYLLNSRGGSK